VARHLMCIGIVFLLIGSALGATGSVLLKSGMEYRNVAYTVDTVDYVLVIEQGGWVQRILPERIERVVDREGRDVTAEILVALKYTTSIGPSNDSVPAVKPAIPATTSAPPSNVRPQRNRRHRLAKPFDLAVGGRVNFSAPFGEYYEGLTAGVGFEGDFRIPVASELSIWFLVSKSGMKVSDSYNPGFYPDYPYQLDRLALSMSAVRYYAGLLQTWPAGHRRENPDLVYMYFGIGAVAHRVNGTMYVHDVNTMQAYVIPGNPSTDTRFAQVFGGGYVIRASKSVGIDLGASLEGVWTRVYNYSGDESVAMKGFALDLKAGVIMLLGR